MSAGASGFSAAADFAGAEEAEDGFADFADAEGCELFSDSESSSSDARGDFATVTGFETGAGFGDVMAGAGSTPGLLAAAAEIGDETCDVTADDVGEDAAIGSADEVLAFWKWDHPT